MNKKWIFPLLLAMLSLPALAQLMLNPTRVTIEKNQRSSQLDLINIGNQAATYRVSLVNRRMNENGDFSPAETALAGEQFADDMVRFSPRQVTIAPGATQVIRLSLRKPAELPEGEYRSHLLIERIADTTLQTSIENKTDADSKDIKIQLLALVGASIPLIVRHGETAYSISISNLALQPASGEQPPALTLTLNRAGTRSSYGDMVVTFIPENATPREIARLGGIAVYVPNGLRQVKIALPPKTDTPISRGTLHIAYLQRPEEGGKVIAEAKLDVP